MVATLLTILSAFTKMGDARKERTFIAVKPDGVQRCLIGDITKRFEQRGYKLVAAKLCKVWSVPAMSDRNVITIFFLLTGICCGTVNPRDRNYTCSSISGGGVVARSKSCLLYTSDAADES